MAQIGDRRKFDGKNYRLSDIRFRPSDARKSKKQYKSVGLLVRVIKTGRVLSHTHTYQIWTGQRKR